MAKPPVEVRDLKIGWLTDSLRTQEITGLFLGSVHPDYPSHSDIMEGRAEGPGHWASDVATIHARELAGLDLSGGVFRDPGVRLAIAELEGELLGFAAVAVVEFDAGRSTPVRFARLDDIVVVPSARGGGLGAALIGWVEEELRAANVSRLFLESGIRNTAAHRFFVSHGFDTVSQNFMKEL